MQIVGTFFHQAGGIGDGAGDISALRAGHGIKHVNALVHHKGFTQVEREEILMDIGETVVAVHQVLVVSAVAHNGGGEFLAAIHRVMQREGKLALADVLLHPMDVIKFKQAGEIVHSAVPNGFVLISKQSRLATIGNLFAIHYGVQPCHAIASGSIIFLKFFYILGGQFGVLLHGAPQLDGSCPGFLGDGAILGQLQQVVSIGNIIQIPILLPLAVHIGLLRVKRLFAEQRVRCKNQLAIHQRKNHHHHNDNHNRNREEAAKESVYYVFRHIITLAFTGQSGDGSIGTRPPKDCCFLESELSNGN